jgi:tetratricopeptide (TPR) repeat protein
LLQGALAALPQPEGPDPLRARAALGRCAARLGQGAEARAQLELVLEQAQATQPERALALRVLADLDAQRGDLAPAQRRLEEALQLALDSRSFDGEARARRGLGHLAALRGELRQAYDHFTIADQLFGSLGDHRTRPLVTLRLVQLERVAGRYPLARQRALGLIELLRQNGQPGLLLDAGTALADVAWRSGDHRLALETAQRLRPMASPEIPASSRLRLARVFVDLGQAEVARQLLPKEKEIQPDAFQDVAAQRAALAARLTADRQQAVDQARWALDRPPALLGLANVAVALDAGWALLRAGDLTEARRAAKQGLSGLPSAGADGDRFELLLLLDRCLPDPRVRNTLGALHDRMVAGWPAEAQTQLQQRADLAGRLQERPSPPGA